jgi:hypothetical protein
MVLSRTSTPSISRSEKRRADVCQKYALSGVPG